MTLSRIKKGGFTNFFFATRASVQASDAAATHGKVVIVVCDIYDDNHTRVIVPGNSNFATPTPGENCANVVQRALNAGYVNNGETTFDIDVRYLMTR